MLSVPFPFLLGITTIFYGLFTMNEYLWLSAWGHVLWLQSAEKLRSPEAALNQ